MSATVVARPDAEPSHVLWPEAGYPDGELPSRLERGTSGTNQVERDARDPAARLPFSSLFMTAAPTITANATAATIASGGDRLHAGSGKQHERPASTIIGNATVNAPDCILIRNSPSSNSAVRAAAHDVTAKAVAGVGGIPQSNNWHVQPICPIRRRCPIRSAACPSTRRHALRGASRPPRQSQSSIAGHGHYEQGHHDLDAIHRGHAYRNPDGNAYTPSSSRRATSD